ncbi:hypothetical protein GPECTOR_5g87 [Gonium pectorale]|uniref:Mediator of RNA polymerase II transcription subunit 25 n=1 Tax=Gonium pectorale TaxID=33097 RepID=A0A150GX89_GONPE|nr:hypothetical protein GPECTOR_5g87 [Gonium pectorale]|eukprot:KXZ54434.1 hypothetical protein GPECTOR_5g87 [Gonium pectorale]
MHHYWHNMRALYVEPLLRNIDRGYVGRVELALVLAGAADWTSDQPVDGTTWTSSVSELRSALDAVQFAGGGFGPIALSQALAHVIYLQTLPSSMPVSPPLPGGGSLPAPADPAVPCYVMLLLVSPADQLPVHVPGLTNPMAPRLGNGCMHTFQSLFRTVQQSYNMHLSVVVVHTRDMALTSKDYVYNLLTEHLRWKNPEIPSAMDGVKFVYPTHREYTAIIVPHWALGTKVFKMELESATRRYQQHLLQQQQRQAQAQAQLQQAQQAAQAQQPPAHAQGAAATQQGHAAAGAFPNGDMAAGHEGQAGRPGVPPAAATQQPMAQAAAYGGAPAGGPAYVAQPGNDTSPGMPAAQGHHPAQQMQQPQQQPVSHMGQAGAPAGVAGGPMGQYPQAAGQYAAMAQTQGQMPNATSPNQYYQQSPQQLVVAAAAAAVAGQMARGAPGAVPQHPQAAAIQQLQAAVAAANKKVVPGGMPQASMQQKPNPQQQQQQARPQVPGYAPAVAGAAAGAGGLPGGQPVQAVQGAAAYPHLAHTAAAAAAGGPAQHLQHQTTQQQQQQPHVQAVYNVPQQQQQPAAVLPQAAVQQPAAAPAVALPASACFILTVPMQWAREFGSTQHDNYQYPIFQVQLLREGGLTPRQPHLADHLFEAFTKIQYANMIRPVMSEELVPQRVIADVRLDVITVTDYEESVQIFNRIVQDIRMKRAAALEVEVPGLTAYSLVIWPTALQTGLAGGGNDSKDPIRGWLVRKA